MNIHSLRKDAPSAPPVYWTVTNFETGAVSRYQFKSDALLTVRTLPHSVIHFHWYEESFSKINYSMAPEKNLAELYRARAQKLRDQSSYLRLWYSGGADSHTALMSFVDNGIHLDEIVVNRYLDRDSDTPLMTAARETTLVALPFLKSIEHRLVGTKITLLDAEPQDMMDWVDFKYDIDSVPAFDSLDGGLGQTYLGMAWGLSKIRLLSDRQLVTEVQGGSKVRLWKNGERWYFYFVDSSMNDSYGQSRVEDFFIDLDYPELYIKTVHQLKQFHLLRGSSDEYVNQLHTNHSDVVLYNHGMGRVDVPLLVQNKSAYSHFDEQYWKRYRIQGLYNTLCFDRVRNTELGQKWYSRYLDLMTYLTTEFPEFWNTNRVGDPTPLLGYRGHYSRFYCLNDGKDYDSTEAMK